MNIHLNKRVGLTLLGIVLLIIGTGMGMYLSRQSQDTRQQAAEVPACLPNQAICAWDALTNTSSYQYQIIDVASGGQVASGTVSGTSQVSFTITPGREYKCTVAAVSTCGTGPSEEAQATCIAPTGVPTVPPTNIPPTNTPTDTQPTVPPSTTPTGPFPTIPPTVCPLPSKITNLRIICPNCSTN